MQKNSSEQKDVVLAYDIGGTKVHTAVVDARGTVLDEYRVAVDFSAGKESVFRQWADAGKRLLANHPEVSRVGVASAGPLDPARGVLLDPTNFVSARGESWGVVPIVEALSAGLGGLSVRLENDAAAAILAEHWVGAARGVNDAVIMTLGTGVGTGMIVGGHLVRAGKGMHTEGGHVIIRAGDVSAPCGCGNLGCAEAYLSGRGFERRANAQLGLSGQEMLSGAELARRARDGDRVVKGFFEEYADLLAITIHNFVMLYAPEVVVLAGSFANASDLYLEASRSKLETLLVRRRQGIDFMPQLRVSSLENRAGVLGGAYIALNAALN
ncbi:MAG: hypothetical protein RJB38_80 [Pseudomonadota bacterium]|jgi:glucokinase